MIRRFNPQDIPQLLEIVRLNIPLYFHPDEEDDYKTYLENSIEDYFIILQAGEIAGAGGINYIMQSEVARISWDLIHPAYQRLGLGRQLTHYRLDKIKAKAEVRTVEVRTTQLVYSFYEKVGFKLINIQKDYWADGFDLYHMKLDLV